MREKLGSGGAFAVNGQALDAGERRAVVAELVAGKKADAAEDKQAGAECAKKNWAQRYFSVLRLMRRMWREIKLRP